MFALGILDCAGCGMTCRSSYHLNRHVPQCRKCLARDHALHIIRQAAVGAAEQHAKRPRINPPVGQALLPRVVPLLRPLRHPALDPITLFGNERTFVYFCYTLHAGQFSHKKADTAIAFQPTDPGRISYFTRGVACSKAMTFSTALLIGLESHSNSTT